MSPDIPARNPQQPETSPVVSTPLPRSTRSARKPHKMSTRLKMSTATLALTAVFSTTVVSTPHLGLLPSAQAQTSTIATAEENNARGNATIAALYAEGSTQAPSDTTLWDSRTGDNNGLNMQSTDSGQCAVTMMGQTTSTPFGAPSASGALASSDVTRNLTVSGSHSRTYVGSTLLNSGMQVTRPVTADETPNRLNGELGVTADNIGNLSLGMDGWVDTRGSVPAYGYVQNVRLRLAFPEPVTNFRMLVRMDDKTVLRETVTTMQNWNGWWAPGYTQAPSGNFNISYSTVDNVSYAVITAASIPAHTWAAVTFQGDVRASDISPTASFNAYSAATGIYPYHCSAPQPGYTAGASKRGTEAVAVRREDLDPMPAGTTYQLPEGYQAPVGWTVRIDTATGDVTATPPVTGLPGATIDVPVEAILNGSLLSQGTATFRIIAEDAPDNVTFFPTYDRVTAERGADTTAESPSNTSGGGFPTGTTFEFQGERPDWMTAFDPADGSAVFHPDNAVPAGEYVFQILVTYPDATTATVPLSVTVPPLPLREVYQPVYQPVTVTQGETVSVSSPTGAPADTTFGRGAGLFDNLDLALDGSGSLTANMPPGTYEIPVRVHYPDDSFETVYLTVTVTAPVVPEIAEGTLTDQIPNDSTPVTLDDTVTNPTAGMTGTVTDANGQPIPGATVTVDPTTGAITVTIPEGTVPGPASVQIKDNLGNNLGGPIDVNITDTATQAETFHPAYPATTAPRDTTTTIPAPTDPNAPLPDGTVYSAGTTNPTWVTVNPDGTITLAPDSTVAAGQHTIEIVVTYPDGSTGTITATVTVPAMPTDTPSPAIDPGSVVDLIPNTGTPVTLDDTVTEPEAGMTGVVTDATGNPISDAVVTVDPVTGAITVSIPEGTTPGPAEVQIKDSQGNSIGQPLDIIVTDVSAPVDPGSSPTDRCLSAGLSVGLPLLFLIPVGLATELNIPGLSPIIDEIERQAAQLNTQFQQQAGIYNPDLARFAERYNDEIRAGALIAAGLLVATYLASNCSPSGSSTSSEIGSVDAGTSSALSSGSSASSR